MRLTVMTNMAKTLRSPPPDPDQPGTPPPDLAAEVAIQLEGLKWFLWHGNVFRALQIVDELTVDLDIDPDAAEPSVTQTKLGKAVREFDSYIRANAERIPNYGERHRAGETISTSFVESTVNQLISKRMVKKQQMRWTPRGAHLLLQVRARVLNDQLADDFLPLVSRVHPHTRPPSRGRVAPRNASLSMNGRGAGSLRVGVVIPAHNAADHIDRALCSLAAQTERVDEVVVVDDGSQDATAAVAGRWSGVLPLRVLGTGQRCGAAAARKAGIVALNTELVMQLDADDFVLPQHVALMRAVHVQRPGLISPRPLHWRGGLDLSFDLFHDARPYVGATQLTQLLMRNYVLVGALYSRELYERSGGYRSTAYAEDWDLWLRMVALGAQVAKPDAHTYVYRTGAPSYSNGVDWDVCDVEVLDRFVAECDWKDYRRVAKFALLGRMGTKYLERGEPVTSAAATQTLRSAGVAVAGRPIDAARDPDLGLLVRTADSLLLIGADPARVVLRARLGGDRLEVVEVEDEHLRVPVGPVLAPVGATLKLCPVGRRLATGNYPWENLPGLR